jgi:hypothetical protein
MDGGARLERQAVDTREAGWCRGGGLREEREIAHMRRIQSSVII